MKSLVCPWKVKFDEFASFRSLAFGIVAIELNFLDVWFRLVMGQQSYHVGELPVLNALETIDQPANADFEENTPH